MVLARLVVAVLVLGLCLVFVPGGRARGGERPLPLAQIVVSASGFSLLTWGLINAERTWVAPTTWGPLVLGVVLLVVFVLLETRSRNRLTDLGLLVERRSGSRCWSSCSSAACSSESCSSRPATSRPSSATTPQQEG